MDPVGVGRMSYPVGVGLFMGADPGLEIVGVGLFTGLILVSK
jgi:hypothetical protein